MGEETQFCTIVLLFCFLFLSLQRFDRSGPRDGCVVARLPSFCNSLLGCFPFSFLLSGSCDRFE